ncbi:cytochrome P450 [Lasiosphaeris hirsuta]|uniref:Cytochrome P450 n=1 Tax=Lasiosphaeris hirsuta TaxID=260670 RepID=A0AA40A0Z6_9PEZI|nr:cytochrome P450 [Lasiosphaeris hirsuta]
MKGVTIYTAGAALLALFIVKYILAGLLNPLSPIPGPWYTRFSTLPSKWHRLRGTKIVWVDSLHRRYGPIVRVDAGQVAIAEPAFWDAVGRVGGGFRKTPFHERIRIGPEHFLFSMTDAKAHAARRRLFARALTADALRRNWEPRWLRDVVGANKVIAEKGTIAVRNLRATGLDRPNLFSNMLAEAEKAPDGDGTGDDDVDGDAHRLTDDAIRSEVAGFLLAGSDTTSMALTYTVWAVLRHPDLQRRLEHELAGLPAAFSDRDLEALPLLGNVLDEALRLYSPGSPGILRLPPREGMTWRGYFIPGDTQVLAQQWTLVRDHALFPDPERFDETRFEQPAEGARRIA